VNAHRRRAVAVGVMAGVLALHAWLLWQLAELTGQRPGDDRPQRLSVLFVRTLQLAAPVAAPLADLPPVTLVMPGPPAGLAVPDVAVAAAPPASAPPVPAAAEPDVEADPETQAAVAAEAQAVAQADAQAEVGLTPAPAAAGSAPAAGPDTRLASGPGSGQEPGPRPAADLGAGPDAERDAERDPRLTAGSDPRSGAASEPASGPASGSPSGTASVSATDPADAQDRAAARAATAASAPPTTAAPGAAFDWPPSTRLRYLLTGHYRGPIDGSAQVEWLREGSRYQVHLDVAIGLSFAPLISRQMSSDGELGPDGLQPRRYDERTRVLLADPQTLALHFDGRRVTLANGRSVPQPAGVQDSVSQFVQLTWRFLMQPSLLRPGQALAVPLALPRRVATWVYDVREPETLLTPVGMVEAVHVQPRPGSRGPGELSAEMWFAPGLQYLPVRILIRQNEATYVDLVIDRLPLQALPAPVAGPTVAPGVKPAVVPPAPASAPAPISVPSGRRPNGGPP
jgi:hypothetical protein